MFLFLCLQNEEEEVKEIESIPIPAPTLTENTLEFNSKINALIHQLSAMKLDEHRKHTKVLIFTQFTQTLELLKKRLNVEGFRSVSLSGSMNVSARSRALDTFKNDDTCNIFILSVRSGAVGLTCN